jgi:hypothetical protein
MGLYYRISIQFGGGGDNKKTSKEIIEARPMSIALGDNSYNNVRGCPWETR